MREHKAEDGKMTPAATVMDCRLFLQGGMVSKGAFSGTADSAQSPKSNTLARQPQRDQSTLLIENAPIPGTLIVERLQRDVFDVVWARNGMEGYALLFRQEPAVLSFSGKQEPWCWPHTIPTAARLAHYPTTSISILPPLQRKLDDGGKPRLVHAVPGGGCLKERKA